MCVTVKVWDINAHFVAEISIISLINYVAKLNTPISEYWREVCYGAAVSEMRET